MSILTTLALVVIPLVKRKDRVEELEKQLAAVRAERDSWRLEALAAHEKLTSAALEQVRLRQVIELLAPVEWTVPTCTPDRATALKGE